MRKYLVTAVILTMFFSCKDKDAEMKQMQQQAQFKSVKQHDSLLSIKTEAQDSTITAYIKSFNDIEDNLDSIKRKAKIMSLNSAPTEGPDKKAVIISDMKLISNLMMRNRVELATMKRQLAASGMKNEELQKMISHLTEELTEKTADIAALQSQLAETNATLKTEIQKFNDSMQVISTQHEIIAVQNTIYYAIGTSKELKNKGVIMKEGGVLGLGGVEKLKPSINKSYFTGVSMYSIHGLPLYSKLDKIITNHPSGSYVIRGDKKADSLIITNQKLFWSESKYLVVIVKPR